MQLKLFGFLYAIIPIFSFSQTKPDAYPQGYFRNPLDIPIKLSANYGELRSNHWHMGLDIRTNQKENLPVHAAAAGYISKIRIEPLGFGRVIFINHPNGFTTIYGHMNGFFPELEKYVREQQYKKESWEIELQIPKSMFTVSKGDFIGSSGNTGASGGAHVHFEIRETKTDKCLNPLLFGFPLVDNTPPVISRLAMYERSISIYEQSPKLFSLKKTEGGYIIPKIPVIMTGSGKLSFAIQAFDRITGSSNPNGIYSATLFFDDEPQVAFFLDNIDYNETHYLNAHIDYRYKHNGGAYLQHLSKLPGDNGPVYKLLNGDGIIILNDTNVHKVRIEVIDAYNNKSVLNFKIQHSNSLMTIAGIAASQAVFNPNEVNVFEQDDFEIHTGEDCMYDTVHILYLRTNEPVAGAVSARHHIADPSIPVHGGITINIKPTATISQEIRDKIVIRRNDGEGNSTKPAIWQRGWLSATFNEFGSFQAFADLTPPLVHELGYKDTLDLSSASRILFQPTDNFGVKTFRAELDGSWLMFTNDKGRSYIYKFDEKCPFGVHELKLIVTDIAGNITTKNWWFKRGPYTHPKKVKSKKHGGGKKKKKK